MPVVKPPTLRALTARLRELHAAWSYPDVGGEYVSFRVRVRGGTRLLIQSDDATIDYPGVWVGREWIPGDGAKFDAVAAARRLLAAVRDYEAERTYRCT